ncbi:hypothetical protein SP15_259 [Bacillus phage SP-15]|uniref:Uncharacterized protein n=1 Tax=Bacillus phage SP-15 TaxID=1792032 RepID=A0A127AWH5_9CAUD|nr:hypothetical protein SP15_259 [Bacillus phage SP-15]AMM45066.1 hypothetical protein SP15_259 [Bacillus phage SP-15]
MIQFLRESSDNHLFEAATMNYNNDDTKLMVDFIVSTFGIDVSASKAGRGSDLIYSKMQDPRTAFMIYIDARDFFYIANATEKEMSEFLGTKRWKAANTSKLTAKAGEAIKNGEVGKIISVVNSQEKAHDKLSKWLHRVGITPKTTEVVTVKSAQPVDPPVDPKIATKVTKTADKVAKSTRTVLLGKSSGKSVKEIEAEVLERLHGVMDMTDGGYGYGAKSPQIEKADSNGWMYASYKAPNLFRSRPGEEDDDWPEFMGYDQVNNQFQKVFKDLLDVIEYSIEGEEKGWLSIAVRVKKGPAMSGSAPKDVKPKDPTPAKAKQESPATSGAKDSLSEAERTMISAPLDYKWLDSFKADFFKKKKPFLAGMWKPVSGFANRGKYVLDHPELDKKLYVSFRTLTTYGKVSKGSRLRDPRKTKNYVEVDMWFDGGTPSSTLYSVASRGEGEDARARKLKSQKSVEQVAEKVFGITSVQWR